MTEEEKAARQYTPRDVAGQLKSSVENVATLPKSVHKITESLKSGQAKKEK